MPELDHYALIRAWLRARSFARGAPAPVFDRGGLRVDTGSADEVRRWVFPTIVPAIAEIGRAVICPNHTLKLCSSSAMLAHLLPLNWRLEPQSWVMLIGGAPSFGTAVPAGFRCVVGQTGSVFHTQLFAANSDLAASGCGVETEEIFVYDRIRTEPAYQRRGLGRAIMASLAARASDARRPHALVATELGRKLYTALGWRTYCAYASATTQ